MGAYLRCSSCRYDKFYQTPRIWLFGYDEVSSSNILLSRAATCLH